MVLSNEEQKDVFVNVVKDSLAILKSAADCEIVDAVEQFFWGQMHGLAIELGALDGTPASQSQTYELEKRLGWRRILVEGNPRYRNALLTECPRAFIFRECSHLCE